MKNLSKIQKFVLCLIFDGIGYLSFFFPPLDILWAPLSAYLMYRLFKSNAGKIASIIVFIEEALPMLDVIPTFTLMFLYAMFFEKKSESNLENKQLSKSNKIL